MLRSSLLQMPRQDKRALQVLADVLLLWGALWLAFFIRLGFDGMINPFGEYLWLFIAAPVTAIPLFIRFGLYRAVLRYFGSEALVTILNAISLSALLLALVIFLIRPEELMPRSVIFIYWALSLLFVGGLRLLMRQYFSGELFPLRHATSHSLPKVAIYGAGAAGNQLLAALRMGRRMQPVAFIDDDTGVVVDFSRHQAKALAGVDHGDHVAAQVDNAQHVARGTRDRGDFGVAQDFLNAHHVDAVGLVVQLEGDPLQDRIFGTFCIRRLTTHTLTPRKTACGGVCSAP